MLQIRLLLQLFLFFTCINTRGQMPAGVWEGTLFHKSCEGASSNWKIELEVNTANKTAGGSIAFIKHGDFEINRITHVFNFLGTIESDNQLTLHFKAKEQRNHRRKRTSENYYTRGTYTVKLLYEKCGGKDVMSGTFRGTNGGRGTIYFKRKFSRDDPFTLMQQVRFNCVENITKAPPIINEGNRSAGFAQRKDSVQARISIKDSIYQLLLYDNGEIDNDTISLFINDSLVLNQQRLANSAVQLFFVPQKGSTYKIRMFAHNEGEIPPNTAMMVIISPSGRKNVFLSADFKINSVILFEWDE